MDTKIHKRIFSKKEADEIVKKLTNNRKICRDTNKLASLPNHHHPRLSSTSSSAISSNLRSAEETPENDEYGSILEMDSPLPSKKAVSKAEKRAEFEFISRSIQQKMPFLELPKNLAKRQREQDRDRDRERENEHIGTMEKAIFINEQTTDEDVQAAVTLLNMGDRSDSLRLDQPSTSSAVLYQKPTILPSRPIYVLASSSMPAQSSSSVQVQVQVQEPAHISHSEPFSRDSAARCTPKSGEKRKYYRISDSSGAEAESDSLIDVEFDEPMTYSDLQKLQPGPLTEAEKQDMTERLEILERVFEPEFNTGIELIDDVELDAIRTDILN